MIVNIIQQTPGVKKRNNNNNKKKNTHTKLGWLKEAKAHRIGLEKFVAQNQWLNICANTVS